MERRTAAVGFSVLTHLLLLWAMLPHALKPQIEAGVMSASLVDGFAPSDIVRQTRPAPSRSPPMREADPVQVRPDVEPLPVADTLPPLDATAEPVEIGDAVKDQVAALAAVAAASSDGDPCAVGAWLQAALQSDAAVQAALETIPRSARSVANAVMLWNGEWPQPSANAAQGMARIRALVVAGVLSAPESCQAQSIRGPVLITLGDPTNTTVLAVGSGEWRWQDLLQESTRKQ